MAYRIERLNQLIRQEISELLHRQINDPRLGGFIAVTEVSTSLDLKYAKIFACRIGGVEEKQEILSALAGASGFLRKELAKRIKVRRIPELRFEWDDSIERGAHLLNLIDKAKPDREH
jgi:ribosome-binding factor A